MDRTPQFVPYSGRCGNGRRPVCQDAGICKVFLKVGMDVRWEALAGVLADAVNEGVRRGYNDADNKLRASIVADPHFERKNTKDNTPAVVHMELVERNTVDVKVPATGGGSESQTKCVLLNPADPRVDGAINRVS